MADEVDKPVTPPPLDYEKVQAVMNLNEVLDDMVAKVIEMVTGAIGPLPSGPAKIAFARKLREAVTVLEEQVKKEVR